MSEVQDFKHGLLDFRYFLLIQSASLDFERKQKLFGGGYLDEECTFLVNNSVFIDDKKMDIWNRCMVQYVMDNSVEIFEQYYEGYLDGVKWFEDNFKVKSPDKDHILNLVRLYNEDWKSNFNYYTAYKYFLNNIQEHGFKNGILSAYIEYEELHLFQFKKYLPDFKKTDLKSEVRERDNSEKDSNIEEFKLLFTKAGYDIEGLRKFLTNYNLKNKNLALLICLIQRQVSPPINFNLKSFMRWINKEAQYKGVSGYLGKERRIEYPNAYTDDEENELLEAIEKFKNF